MNFLLSGSRIRNVVRILVGIIVSLVLLYSYAQLSINTKYDIGFMNKTGHKLEQVSLYSHGKLWGFPVPLVVGGETTQGWMTEPIPTEAEVKITDNGEHKSVMVSLKDIPTTFGDGTIYFIINRDGTVQAKALKRNDMAGYAELIKGLRPEGEYRFAFVNRTGHDLQAVSIYYNEQKVGSGNDIPARARANFSYSDPLTTPCPTEAGLRWTQDSLLHAVKVKLDKVPKGFEGDIFLVIKTDGTIEVHLVKNGDDKAAFELVK